MSTNEKYTHLHLHIYISKYSSNDTKRSNENNSSTVKRNNEKSIHLEKK